ncbi:uncharacterized protein LOC110612370 [Manihot esculenta]|uniref:3'-5' exonuclease domain-containing protein n=1 Tax=Manihot esculenta TaxID=3983 RepID=A0A2C9W997_MANES|nr:uncharacterized protein LOC110612370 [Manihot esculenta]OAY56155.1 hypothetical protein MANES_03G206700v8 [Manihot esculenta]
MTPKISIARSHPCDFRLYSVQFFDTPIEVTVTSSATVVRKWLRTTLFLRRRYLGRLVVGLGVQWTPPNTAADTLQLCVGSRCLIIQLSLAATVPLILRRFLLDSNTTFVGIWNGSDEKKLWMTEHELRVHRLVDLRRYVRTRDGESLARASVERIVEEHLGYKGVRLERDISMSDWDVENLSYEQVLQACIDAHVAFEIGKDLRAWEL